MRTETNFINYGIYIDRKHAYISSFDHLALEKFLGREVVYNDDDTRTTRIDQQEHAQNYKNDHLAKMCGAILEKIVHPHSVLIFGPAQAKYELQKQLRDSRHLKHVIEELATTDVMDEDEAIRFAADHYTAIQAGHQTFTAARKG